MNENNSNLDILHEMNKRFDKIDNRFDNLDKEVAEIKKGLNATIEQTALISEYHTETMEAINKINENLQYYDTQFLKHDKQLHKINKAKGF